MSTPNHTTATNPGRTSMEFTVRPLYGASLTTSLPQDYIDASTIRQIPDNQEVFLSRDTLTSIIFEINEYQSLADDGEGAANGDLQAVMLHFTDAIDESDRPTATHGEGVRVTMGSPSLAKFPAYLLTGEVSSRETRRQPPSTEPVAVSEEKATIAIHQILIRLQEHGTDLCVRVNVPLQELRGEEELSREMQGAKMIIEEIVRTLEVTDFELFGA